MDYKMLHLLLRCAKEFGNNRLRGYGVNDTEAMLCSYIYHNPACSQEAAARSLRMDKTTTAKAIAVLEKKGLIRRSRNAADNRKNELYITDEGAVCLNKIAKYHDAWISDVFSCLKPDEQKQFDRLFRKVLKKAEERLSQDEEQ